MAAARIAAINAKVILILPVKSSNSRRMLKEIKERVRMVISGEPVERLKRTPSQLRSPLKVSGQFGKLLEITAPSCGRFVVM